MDKLQQSSENKIYIELFVDGRYGSVSANRLEKTEIEKLVLNGITSTRYLSEDKYRQLPDHHRYFKNSKTDGLDLYDEIYKKLSTAEKMELARNTVEEVLGKDNRIVSVTASYGDGYSSEYMIASNGFEGESNDTAFSLTAEVSLKTDIDARPEAYWYDSKVYWNDLQKTGISTIALERALRKLGQKKLQSGTYNMVVDNTVSARLLSPIISAMYGTALQQKNSFLLDKLGEIIGSDKLTVYDRPHIPKSFGARFFDGEGVATHDRTLIGKGILNTYFIDTYSSLKMKVMPTISSPSILLLEEGQLSLHELLKKMNNGIWVTGFNGGNCNPTTGDFSFGIEGFLIENGDTSQPVSEMNITGNITEVWKRFIGAGNDARTNSSWRVPSLLFYDMSFNGY